MSRLSDGLRMIMQQYLTKADTHEGKWVCAKKDVNIQGQIQTR